MYRIAGSSFCLIVATAVCSLPAFALEPLAADARAASNPGDGDAAAICEVGVGIDQAVLLAAYTGESPNDAGAPGPRAEAPDALPTGPMDSGAERPAADQSPPDTVLSLLQPAPRPPQVATRAVDDEPAEDWIRTDEKSTVSEPGLWAVLIAGFLGVCAMARRRIFSS